ncbi:hypothetical protein Ciccas_003083 [Cichlidogyrus casuarinus]|uniref:Uncharacterized protein n=1 Tax=Cichlidogyrus casuarinus TaxID=1844966 RepID=A0ABD2QFD7_9PLAT
MQMGSKGEEAQENENQVDTSYYDLHSENVQRKDTDETGPTKKHSCTDVICLVFFFLCLAAQSLIAILAFRHGDPRKLLKPTDYRGNLCGYGEMADKPYLFMFDLTACIRAGMSTLNKGCPTPQVCVEKCPTHRWSLIEAMARNIVGYETEDVSRSNMICTYGVNATNSTESIVNLVTSGKCAPYYTASHSTFGRCLPIGLGKNQSHTIGYVFVNRTLKELKSDDLKESEKSFLKYMQSLSNAKSVFADVIASWKWIVGLILLGAFVTFIYCFFIKYISKVGTKLIHSSVIVHLSVH